MQGLACYQQLPVFETFAELTDARHFAPLPADWSVIVTDLEGSTEAIAAGRYRDVNTLGAASIAVAQNALATGDFPYVFGGDGATIVLPPEGCQRALPALGSLQELAARQFGLSLRVGAIRIDELEDHGERVQVARFQLTPGRTLAFFTGGGLALADQRIKAEPERYTPAEMSQPHSLAGLSCRWNAIPNRRGVVMSLLVLATGEDPAAIYAAVLDDLHAALGGLLDEHHPINLPAMTYKPLQQILHDERRWHGRRNIAYWYRMTEIVLAVLVFRHGVPPIGFDKRHYAESTPVHADYRKFDDLLRMVLDCTPEQVDAIDAALAARHAAGELCYGIHRADTALMTCLVEGLTDGRHIHFIDGGDGGYAVAAKQMKVQLRGR